MGRLSGTGIDGHTVLVGLLGWPVGHSRSPAMHNAAAAALGVNLAYVPLPVRPNDLAAAVRGLAALGFRGCNVTIPHKEAIVPLLDAVDPAATAIGAVNTVVVSRSADNTTAHLTGYNTDWRGFLDDLNAHGVSPTGRDCVILGAGGSARAVAYALAHAGGRVHVLARRPEQAAALVEAVGAQPLPGNLTAHALADLPSLSLRSPLVVNTTPLGMTPHVNRTPWPDDLPLPPGAFVYDLVYAPAETLLMRQAAAAGCGAANGLGMLVGQGAAAFELWTGRRPDSAVMAAAIE